MTKRILKTNTKQYVDPETGELIVQDTSKEFVVKTTADAFFMTFINYTTGMYDGLRVKDRELLEEFCKLAEFDTGVINLSAALRTDICDKLSINPSNFSKHIRVLKDNGLITGDRGKYNINPKIFWKGSLKSREQALKEGLDFTLKFVSE